MLCDYEFELKFVCEQLDNIDYDPALTAFVLTHNKNMLRRGFRVSPELRRLLIRRSDLEATIRRLNQTIDACYSLVCESASEGEISTDLNITQNFTDAVGADSSIGVTGISTVPMGMKHNLRVDDFFSRPISIVDFEEKVGDEMNYVLPVWELYTSAPSVRAKLRNYSYLKADLMVMIEVSGTPFHYGKALISYQAYNTANVVLSSMLTSVTNDALARPCLLNYLSQSPGAVTIDYNGNRPVLMKCPFISPKPMHRLYNGATTVISAATPYEDMTVAGSLFIYSINLVAAATASPTPIGVHVYAWLENVELGMPTGTQIDITTESGRDERKTGPVEKVSTALVRLSDALGVIPEIAPFAKASSMFFSGVSHLASIFGWSRPLIVDKASFVKNRPFTNAAFGITSDTSEKISLDPMQELSVDPRVVGIKDDELAISYLTGISSYLTTFSWAEGDAVGTPIWACGVHPQMDTYMSYDTNDYLFQPSALSFAVAPFEYWRGTVKYRFEIVCSHFHRGKFLIRYEPNAEQYALIETDSSLNKQFTKVIDIQETQDVEFCIKYAQPYTWCTTVAPPVSRLFHGSLIDIPSVGETIGNGFISIRPFTALQSPDLSNVAINVYVSGEDMQVNLLNSSNFPSSRLVLPAESGNYGTSPEIGYTCFELNEVSDTGLGCTEYCFGEQPLSFRTCLKRYGVYEQNVYTLGATGHKSITFNRDVMPLPSLLIGGSSNSAPATAYTLWGYLQYAFLGIKGSTRHRFHTWVVGNQQDPGRSTVVTFADVTSSDASVFTPSVSTPGCSVNVIGGAIFDQHTNSGVEVETPYYSPNLFHFAFSNDRVGGLTNGMLNTAWVRQMRVAMDNPAVSVDVVFTHEISVGEDFQLLRFNGAPFYTSVNT
jgi:hypothetical protein